MIARILAALRPRKPWSPTWCRVVAMHMITAEAGTGYRRTMGEEWP